MSNFSDFIKDSTTVTAHIADADKHREINDSGSGTTDLWSAEKIETRVVTATGTLTTDHGELDGLADDDHTQYHNNTRGDARYYTETELDTGQLDNRYYTETEINTWRNSTTQTEMGYVHGLTSDAQTQLNGVIKQNLLSNSGFGVWSNSTLENVGSAVAEDDCADDDTGDWSHTGTSLIFDTDHYEFTVNTVNRAIYSVDDFATLTAGKLYKLSIDVKNGTATGQTCTLATMTTGAAEFIDTSPAFTTTAEWTTHTFVVEAEGTERRITFTVTSNPGGNNIEIKNITLYEVTPGCVAADTKACDGWHKTSTLDVWRQHSDATYTKDGSFYSLKIVKGSDGAETINTPLANEELTHTARFAGRTVTLGAWIYSVSANDNVKIRIYDGNEWQTSSSFAGAGAWEWMEFTITIDAAATNVLFAFLFDGDTSDVAYISQPMLVFGSSIGEGNYSQPTGEWVDCETKMEISTSPFGAGLSDGGEEIYLEPLSNGKIPKGWKALKCKLLIRDSGSAAAASCYSGVRDSDFENDGFFVQLEGVPNDKYREGTSVFHGNNGSAYIVLSATGAATLDVYFYVYQIIV